MSLKFRKISLRQQAGIAAVLFQTLFIGACGKQFQALKTTDVSESSLATVTIVPEPTESSPTGQTPAVPSQPAVSAPVSTPSPAPSVTIPAPLPEACPQGKAMFEGSCSPLIRACPVQDGLGQQSLSNGNYGACVATSCNQDFTLSNGTCFLNTKACSTSQGTGIQTFHNGAYGECVVSRTCLASETLYQGNCYPSVRACSIENGTGQQFFGNGSYGNCAIRCNQGFNLVRGACTPNNIVDASASPLIQGLVSTTSSGSQRVTLSAASGQSISPISTIRMNGQPKITIRVDLVTEGLALDLFAEGNMYIESNVPPDNGECNISWYAPEGFSINFGNLSFGSKLATRVHYFTITNFNPTTWRRACQVVVTRSTTGFSNLNIGVGPEPTLPPIFKFDIIGDLP